MRNGVFVAGCVAAGLGWATSVEATVVAHGSTSPGQRVEWETTPLGSEFAPFGVSPEGYAKTITLTVWSTQPLQDGDILHFVNLQDLYLSFDGTVDRGIDHIDVSENFGLPDDPRVARTEHSWTVALHLPWSTQIPQEVCCGPDLTPKPGYEQSYFKSYFLGGALRTSLGSAPGEYWVTMNDLAPPSHAVPEPAAWAMMIAGFGMVGGALRRRRAALA